MSTVCSGCHLTLHDESASVAGASYHPKCYVCHNCKESLKGKACQVHEGKLYDLVCYKVFCASRCYACRIPITGNHVKYVKVGNRTFHTSCYVCSCCKKPLEGKGCQTYEGRLFDTNCYAAFCASRCDKCHKPIDGDNVKFVKVGNKSFHSKCYVCNLCRKTLQGVQHFTAENSMRICVPCLTM